MTRQTTMSLLVTILIIAILGFTAFLVDTNLVLKEEKPKFSILSYIYDDGGSKEYIGLGYKIINYNVLNGRQDFDAGSWLLKYNSQIDTTTNVIKEKETNKTFEIRGVIKTIEQRNSKYEILVKSTDSKSMYEELLVVMAEDTKIYKDGKIANTDLIKLNTLIEVTTKGIVTKSVPPQATASEITIK